MPPKPNYFHELSGTVRLLEERLESARKDLEKLAGSVETLKESVASLRQDMAVFKQQSADNAKRVEKWDRRWWGLFVILIGAVLSLAAGLIVTFARR